ncbi:hypothetical protein IPV08_03935 [Methylobacterium sp. SD274]|uniref:hypothetical protein n=1 Tax=Methylobacterium sp. SD274 TaxID=2782009 RepID=UPI001A95BD41|nr:hypothetical protein [Methylobacterium sp. SD274]MBO1019117.1 hypothetical protein [Methylobacterium sp. SD274]
MSETTKPTETLTESTSDRSRGGGSGKPEQNSAATGPKDTVSGIVQETPDDPSDRPGTEAEEAAR